MGFPEDILVLSVLSKEKNQDNATFVPIVVLVLYEYKIGVRLKKMCKIANLLTY